MSKVFKINDYITLKLENNKTNIYVKDELFLQCKFLLITIPTNKVTSLKDIDSMDETEDKLSKKLKNETFQISPEIEFWDHCSNLQVSF
ncbi:MAG: hypothetical protein ACFFCI_02015 [Promethearchaeota archaeon]